MVNYDLLSLIAFFGLLLIFFFWKREKFTVQGKIFALYKTKLGLKFMDKVANKFPRLMKFIGDAGILVGFAGMVFIFVFLIKETFKFVSTPGAPPPLSPVLPGITIPGAPTLSFWHWIIAIFIVAIVHEFAHGIQARANNIKIKSSGFAFLGPILAAFVEPDEKQLVKTSKRKQLSVFAAGPFSNLVLGVLFLLLFIFILAPVASSIFQPSGIIIGSYVEGYPAEKSGLELPFTLKQINGEETLDIFQFINASLKIKPGDEVNLVTDKGEATLVAVANPDNESKGFLGVTEFKQKRDVKEKFANYKFLGRVLMWFNLLVFWLFLINVGIGLFNLLPLGIVDGGRMFMVVATKVFKERKTALRVFGVVTWICLLLIFINLWPWIMKLLAWLGKGLFLLISLV